MKGREFGCYRCRNLGRSGGRCCIWCCWRPSRCCCWGIIGGVVGAIAGSDIAQTNNQKDDSNDWQEEDNYWRENYKKMPYYTEDKNLEYDQDYRAAYRLGYENRVDNNAEINFSEVESKLKTKWEQVKGSSRLQWEEAKFAVEDGLKKFILKSFNT